MNVQGKGQVYKVNSRSTPTGTHVVTFSVRKGVKDKRSGEWSSQWFNCVCFGANADSAATLQDKTWVELKGFLQQRTWKDKSGGNRETIEIVVLELQPANTYTQGEQSAEDDIPF